ncbi:AMP-binding protein [Mesorhizobium microcysteis]|uniref:AMP-binding protein n=1 Tax=Neoaquamicrobium microcysteis TaxID=2682781 RepID=A0A5D4GQL6_9HYPH|nr:AMP-binding protein [Mesorhizobium microcysteis]TYR30464.1 AMP-binding protein [Mesorhizobium microcysteis]
MTATYNISAGFLRSVGQYPDRLFYSDTERDMTYGEMGETVSRLAGYLCESGRPRRVGVLATRSMEAYAGILAAGLAGAAYVPLNLKWPEERIVALLRMLELDALVVDAKGAGLLTPAVMEAAPRQIIIADGARDIEAPSGKDVVRLGDIGSRPMREPAQVGADDTAYIIFTSGTTGLPKGVMISAGSLASYLEQTRLWTQLTCDDRLAETCDVTFDLTVHNLFLCVEAGASLHVLSALEMLAPGRFVRARNLTVWMSVPTLVAMMRRNRSLKPGVFPSLRLSIFCGEPLPVEAARAWAEATPNGVVENIYGPTEGTVVCMRQRLTAPAVTTPSRGIVAIGTPYENMDIAILDARQKPLVDGTPGEIALSGPQLAIGYFGAPEQTADRFRKIDGRRWYLTGDLGMRDENGVFHHLGRTDNQVKVKGNRIELEEVEMHLRRAAGTDMVAVVAWPVIDGSAQGLVGFCNSALPADEIAAALLKTLPRYMMPDPIRILDTLPVNINGKVDRRALAATLDAASQTETQPKDRPALAVATSGAIA